MNNKKFPEKWAVSGCKELVEAIGRGLVNNPDGLAADSVDAFYSFDKDDALTLCSYVRPTQTLITPSQFAEHFLGEEGGRR